MKGAVEILAMNNIKCDLTTVYTRTLSGGGGEIEVFKILNSHENME